MFVVLFRHIVSTFFFFGFILLLSNGVPFSGSAQLLNILVLSLRILLYLLSAVRFILLTTLCLFLSMLFGIPIVSFILPKLPNAGLIVVVSLSPLMSVTRVASIYEPTILCISLFFVTFLLVRLIIPTAFLSHILPTHLFALSVLMMMKQLPTFFGFAKGGPPYTIRTQPLCVCLA